MVIQSLLQELPKALVSLASLLQDEFMDDFPCSKFSSDPPQEEQEDQNQKDQAESAAGIVSPAPAVRPGG